MCLASPAEVIALLDDERAIVRLGGVRKEVSVALLDAVAVGDFVVVHVGFALSRLDPAEAERTLAALAEVKMHTGR
jgi:hydrogenase expression/formation protein HypC